MIFISKLLRFQSATLLNAVLADGSLNANMLSSYPCIYYLNISHKTQGLYSVLLGKFFLPDEIIISQNIPKKIAAIS